MSETQHIYDYTKAFRYGVIRKLEKFERYKCNFSKLYDDRAEAEKEAVRLAKKFGDKFYVIEIQRIASVEEQRSAQGV